MKEEQGSSRGQHKNLQQGKQEQQQKRGKDRGWGRGRGQPGGSLCPERPCVSGLLLMTLSWVGSPTAAPGRKQSWMWMSLLRAPLVKNPPANAGNRRDLALIPGSGRPPRGGNGNSFQYSFLENHHGQRSLVGCSPWGHTESDRTELLSMGTHAHIIPVRKSWGVLKTQTEAHFHVFFSDYRLGCGRRPLIFFAGLFLDTFTRRGPFSYRK